MTVEDKIIEAERWLNKIKQSYPHDQVEVQDNVNSFLSAVNSIPDHLLNDYNEKYKLGITLDDDLYPSTFEKEVNPRFLTRIRKISQTPTTYQK